tara:strand:- start:1129 stop:1647 length:519 start_codon:yes stop_codon:yes gene_type:complete
MARFYDEADEIEREQSTKAQCCPECGELVITTKSSFTDARATHDPDGNLKWVKRTTSGVRFFHCINPRCETHLWDGDQMWEGAKGLLQTVDEKELEDKFNDIKVAMNLLRVFRQRGWVIETEWDLSHTDILGAIDNALAASMYGKHSEWALQNPTEMAQHVKETVESWEPEN